MLQRLQQKQSQYQHFSYGPPGIAPMVAYTSTSVPPIGFKQDVSSAQLGPSMKRLVGPKVSGNYASPCRSASDRKPSSWYPASTCAS